MSCCECCCVAREFGHCSAPVLYPVRPVVSEIGEMATPIGDAALAALYRLLENRRATTRGRGVVTRR